MPHLAVSDLTLGKSDRAARGLEQGHREALRQRLPGGSPRKSDRVAFPFLSIAPPVEDDEHNGALLLGHFVRISSGVAGHRRQGAGNLLSRELRSEEHTSELQSRFGISYA